MNDGLARWLRLREASDEAARSERLTRAVAGVMPAQGTRHLLDLATGTGSNIRYLAPRLSGSQHWLAVDRSAELLAELPRRMSEWGAERGFDVRTDARTCVISGPHFDCRIDLKQADLGVLSDASMFEGRHLVTASALLDLVSKQWLAALALQCRTVGAAALFAITYDGGTVCDPPEHEDAEVLALFNRHQRTDKGLGGPAAGPDAVHAALSVFGAVGYEVLSERSDWIVEPSAREMQRMLLAGWAEASAEIAPDRAGMIAGWRARRDAHIDAGTSRVRVGHEDLAAYVLS